MSRGAGDKRLTIITDWLWVQVPFEEIKYLMFSCLRSGVVAKRGVEFRHSTRNVSFLVRVIYIHILIKKKTSYYFLFPFYCVPRIAIVTGDKLPERG